MTALSSHLEAVLARHHGEGVAAKGVAAAAVDEEDHAAQREKVDGPGLAQPPVHLRWLPTA